MQSLKWVEKLCAFFNITGIIGYLTLQDIDFCVIE